MQRFLSQFGTRDDVVVLAGRCYENESVPYKALDGVVDDLSRYLASIPREHVERLMPSDMPALTQVFPVLLQVEAIANARRDQERGSVDPLDLRRRAFEALRELLGRLADRGSLVVWIDDLQWADADSAVLLDELLRPPGPPAMLTVLCFRSEETAAKPFLQALLERAGQDAWSTISLEPMTEDEALALIGGLLPADSALTDRDKHRMTREAGGSPFVLEQLARYAGVNRLQPNQAPTFAAMFETRLGTLSAGCAPLPRDAGDLRPADGTGAHLRRVRGRAREAVPRGDAPLLPLHSQQRLVGTGRDVSRSDSRGACRADCPRRGAPHPRP